MNVVTKIRKIPAPPTSSSHPPTTYHINPSTCTVRQLWPTRGMFRHQDYVPGGRPQCGGGKVHENAKFTRENEYHKFPRHDYEKHKICYWWHSRRHTTETHHTTPCKQFKEIDFGGVFSSLLGTCIKFYFNPDSVEAVRMKNVSSRRTLVVVSRNSSVVQPE